MTLPENEAVHLWISGVWRVPVAPFASGASLSGSPGESMCDRVAVMREGGSKLGSAAVNEYLADQVRSQCSEAA